MKPNSSLPVNWNEETLRSHVLLPWLRALGIAEQNVLVEKSFKIRLGRSVHEMLSTSALGRADVVVTNASKEPLFVVELKAPGSELTDDDRDQGISYARLLDRIAPFVLISNGTHTRIYDVLTKAEIDKTEWDSNARSLLEAAKSGAPDDIRLRTEALEHFVGYSAENVSCFSRKQVERRSKSLIGTQATPGKFVPSLYVPRASFRQAFGAFLSASAPVFALVGDSGVGKSNEMCALALDLSRDHIVLFYACHEIAGDPAAAIADDFNWNFSQQLPLPHVMSHLHRLARSSGRPALLFFDALDECGAHGFPESFNALAGHVLNMDCDVRLVVSAKSTEWNRFASLLGNQSNLAIGLIGDDAFSLDGVGGRRGEPFRLDEFDDAELNQAAEKYQEFYELSAAPAGRLRSLCRVPFFLRVVGETYSHDKAPLPSDLGGSDLALSWIKRKIALMRGEFTEWRAITSLAKSIYENVCSGRFKGQTLGAMETLSDDDVSGLELDQLIAHGVVIQFFDAEHRASFRFHHSRILYYLIARHVLRLDKVEVSAFREMVPTLMSNHVLQSVLAWHMREAPAAHRSAVSDELMARGLLFASTYSEIFKQLLPAIRLRVPPYVEGDIGIAFTTNSYGLEAFGYRSAVEERLVVEERTDPGREWSGLEKLSRIGCVEARGGGIHFGNTEPQKAAGLEAEKYLHEAVTTGGLDERVSTLALIESALAICTHHEHRRKLRLGTRLLALCPRKSVLPIDLQEIACRVQEYFGEHAHRRDWEAEQVRAKSEYVEFFERGGGYRITCPWQAAADFSARAKRDARAGVRFSGGRNELSYLVMLIDELERRGIKVIDRDVLPEPDLWPERPSNLMDLYSDERALELIREFFAHGLSVYRSLVLTNLSAIGAQLERNSRWPLSVVATWQRPSHGSRDSLGHVHWGFVEARSMLEIAPSASLYAGSPIFARNETGEFVAPDGRRVESWQSCDLRSLLRPYRSVGFGAYTDSYSASRDAPIRAFAYDLLAEDVKTVRSEVLISLLKREPMSESR